MSSLRITETDKNHARMQKYYHLKYRGVQFLIELAIGSTILGILSTISLAPYNWPAFRYLIPVLLIWAAIRYKDSYSRLLFFGLASGLSWAVFGTGWFFESIVQFENASAPTAFFFFLLYGIFSHTKYPLFLLIVGYYSKHLKRRLGVEWLIIPIVATILDVLTPEIFPLYWGNFLAGNNKLAQISEITGIPGLTFLLFFVGYWIYRILSLFKSGHWRHRLRVLVRLSPVFRIYLIPSCFSAILVWGHYREIEMIKSDYELPEAVVGILQPNTPPAGLEPPLRLSDVQLAEIFYKTIPELGERLKLSPNPIDLVVLPESAIPYYSTQQESLTITVEPPIYAPVFSDLIRNIALATESPIIYNENTRKVISVTENRKAVKEFNSATLFSPEGIRLATYSKRKLMIGEEILFVRLFEEFGLDLFLSESILSRSRYWPGAKSRLLPISNNRNAIPLICYEAILPFYLRSFDLKRGDLIINLTQDGWYGPTRERAQHFELARIRAIESRRALVRAATSGISGAIGISGRPLRPLLGPVFTGIDETDVQVFAVPLNNGMTFFARYGFLWFVLPCSCLLLLVAYRIVIRKWTRQHQPDFSCRVSSS